uniref:Uncharacterized protein n=1 Tax=Solanum tuberosum TaxID=4113 RepID=M1DB63_SOLTU
MVNTQELEAQRQRLGLEVETTARGAQQNVVNNPPKLMDEVAKKNRAWQTRDAEVEDLEVTFGLSNEQRRRDEERDQDMAHMQTQMDLLTKHIMELKLKSGAQEEAGFVETEEGIISDDTMVQYVHLHEFDPAERQQLIDCFHSMWTVNRSKDFFKNGILNKSGGFKNRPIMPETRVVVADIKSFPDIYRIFQQHQFEWMNNTPDPRVLCFICSHNDELCF